MIKHWFLLSLMRMADGQVFNTYVQAPGYVDALELAIRKTDPTITGATRNAFSVLLAVEHTAATTLPGRRWDSELTAAALNSGAKWV